MVRLSINVSPEIAAALQDYSKRKGVTATESVRRAISLLDYMDKVQQRQAGVFVRQPDGNLHEVVFFI